MVASVLGGVLVMPPVLAGVGGRGIAPTGGLGEQRQRQQAWARWPGSAVLPGAAAQGLAEPVPVSARRSSASTARETPRPVAI